jgi:hypothetical protein
MRITSDDLDGNIPDEEKEWQQTTNQATQTASAPQGQGLSQYSGMLREVKEILGHLQDMGVMGQQQGQMQQPNTQQPQQGQSMQQSQPQPQGNDTGQSIDQAVNQAYSQLMQFTQVAQQELGKDATLEDTEKWMVESEGDLKDMIRMQIEGQL